jgi:hypothetical protein
MMSNVARVGSFGILIPFILYGLILSFAIAWRTRDEQQRSTIVLLWLFCIVYTGIHLLTWALIRYRLPVDAVLIFFAAIGLCDACRRITSLFARRPMLSHGVVEDAIHS